jgi:hypothetical protein
MKMMLPAFTSGLLAGGLLFHQFGYANKNVQLYGWQWYQVGVLLAAIGLAGVLPKAWPSVATVLGLGIAPILVLRFEFAYLHPTAEGVWPIIWMMVFLLSFPAPIVGNVIGVLAMRTRSPRAVYFVALLTALVIGVLLPILTNPRSQRLETEKVPGLLKQIYDAEMIYNARQPDGNFACDGTLLPGTAGKLNWQHGSSAEVRKYLTVDYYEISLDCPNAIKPRSFRVTARSKDGYILAPNLSMDETGKLVVEPATNTSPRYSR